MFRFWKRKRAMNTYCEADLAMSLFLQLMKEVPAKELTLQAVEDAATVAVGGANIFTRTFNGEGEEL